MEEILLFSVGLAAVVSVIMEFVKYTFKINERAIPAISILIGVLASVGAYFIPEILVDLSIYGMILAGAIAGLTATGFYENSKQVTNKLTEVNNKK